MGRSILAIVAVWMAVACTPDEPPADESAASDAEGTGRFPGGSQATYPNPVVRLVPMDGATDIGATPLQVRITNQGAPIEGPVEEVADRIRLHTYPGGEPLSFNTEIENELGFNGTVTMVRIMVRPDEELQKGWYELRLESVPDWLTEPYYPSHIDVGDGIGVRFAAGSHPTVMWHKMCRGSEIRKLSIEFSERIRVTPSLAEAFRVGVGGRTCAGGAFPAGQASTHRVMYECPDGAVPDAAAVDVVGEVYGTSGLPLGNLPPNESAGWEFASSEAEPWGEGCVIFRP